MIPPPRRPSEPKSPASVDIGGFVTRVRLIDGIISAPPNRTCDESEGIGTAEYVDWQARPVKGATIGFKIFLLNSPEIMIKS